MAPFTVAGKLRTPLAVACHRIKYINNSTRYHTSSSSSQNPKPFITVKRLAALTGASLCLAYAAKSLIDQRSNDQFWWRWRYRPAISNENWDHHGLPEGTTFKIHDLSRFKRYKVSDLQLKKPNQENHKEIVVPLNSIYTKSQLEKEIKTLETSQSFKFVELQGFANPNGTIRVILYYKDRTWPAPTNFRCINVSGLHPLSESKQERAKMVSGMSSKEKREYLQQRTIEYQRKVGLCKPCMLSNQVNNEIIYMLRGEEVLSVAILKNIQDSVLKWYHDNGYVCAVVVGFGKSHASDIVCEVLEGDITEVVFRFQDKLGNSVQDTTRFEAVTRKLLPKQLDKGGVYNREAANRYVNDAMELGLFSNVRLTTPSDKKAGIIVDIQFCLKEPIVD